MHLLSVQDAPAALEGEAVDLGQSPADVLILSAADTELGLLAEARAQLDGPDCRLASLLHLAHPLSVDLYVERMLPRAKLVIVRLIGGRAYWTYGVEQVAAAAAAHGVATAFLSGEERFDEELARASSLPREELVQLHAYLAAGGRENARRLLAHAMHLIGRGPRPALAVPAERAGIHHMSATAGNAGRTALLVFYRALHQAGDLAPVDAMIAALEAREVDVVALFVASLRDTAAQGLVAEVLRERPPGIILNMTGFAVGSRDAAEDPLAAAGCPVLQVVLSSDAEAGWSERQRGLAPRDLAMQVALPEVDGRILSRAVSFKEMTPLDPLTGIRVSRHRQRADRIDWTADLAAGWLRLRQRQAGQRRVALVLPNYPVKDGYIANAVGLDAPASTVGILGRLAAEGYRLDDPPGSPAELMQRLQAGITNALPLPPDRVAPATLELAGYEAWLDAQDPEVRAALLERWGPAARDPFVRDERFMLPVLCLGNVVVGLQPSRGYGLDPVASFHSTDLVPPHAYLAFYLWLRTTFAADAVVHVGKHGTLEWLPGKAMALSATCWPELALGPVPHLYPFIVNDPGEGTQAKRRTAAVIIDHLTPPLDRAGAGIPELERLLDEYAQAQNLDPRRAQALQGDIFDLVQRHGLDRDLGIADEDLTDLVQIDRHLCDLKELQIPDGLHVFGVAPGGEQRAGLLQSLTRPDIAGGDMSLEHALAQDLGLDCEALFDVPPETPWNGPRPAALEEAATTSWRLTGSVRERLHHLGRRLLLRQVAPQEGWTMTQAALDRLAREVDPLLTASAAGELANLVRALDGRSVPPGPSGAPTRGRLDVLPTGRNFFSVDTRAIPTPAAWRAGFASASALVERFLQIEGDWPRRLAVSAWGTANMRTGGEDIAQVLALMGCRPRWDEGTGRVAGVEIMPVSVLGRPRVDVTLQISGLFRDAFPAQIEFIDDAVRAVAALDEPAAENPLAASARRAEESFVQAGVATVDARRLATLRIFGAAPGRYGTGLQDLAADDPGIDDDALADRFIDVGGHAYGRGVGGRASPGLLRERLGQVDLVVQNQDNREHDLLDSDGYFQFEGGLALAARRLAGRQPVVFHLDQSVPGSPRVRSLKEELALIVRGRAANPKWIEGVMRHGYRGGTEIAATVDFLYAFALTSAEVEPHHFEQLYEAYLDDPAVVEFLKNVNPAALAAIGRRFDQAIERGLWQPRRNSVRQRLDELGRVRAEA